MRRLDPLQCSALTGRAIMTVIFMNFMRYEIEKTLRAVYLVTIRQRQREKELAVQFHFLSIFVGRVDRIHKTTHLTILFFYFFWGRVEQIFQNNPRRYLSSWWLDISNCVFTIISSTNKIVFVWEMSNIRLFSPYNFFHFLTGRIAA